MTKAIHVYQFNGRYVMHPVCFPYGIDCLPGFSLGADATPKELGEMVFQALEQSKTVTHDVDPKMAVKEAAKIAPTLLGLKSWSALMKSGAISCGIEQDEGFIRIMPLKNMGPRGGFQPLEGGIETTAPTTVLVVSERASPQEVGDTLLKALGMSR